MNKKPQSKKTSAKDTVKDYSWIAKHLLLAVAFVLLIALLSGWLLSVLTQHGKEITVPDFTNMTYEEASAEARAAGVKVEVTDSVYVRQMRRDAVYNQTPKAGEQVKKGRTVRLTTNSRQPKKIAMPSLVGLSMFMAKAELQTKGLQLGKLIYQNDIATNNVLGQRYRGRDIAAGTMISSGSSIDLVVGLNHSDGRTYVPDLKGRKYMRAMEILHDNSLNIGKVRFDSSVRTYADSINAVVFSQTPPADKRVYDMGTAVSIELTTDLEKLSK